MGSKLITMSTIATQFYTKNSILFRSTGLVLVHNESLAAPKRYVSSIV